MTVTTENISMEAVVVLIEENALQEMELREARLTRQIRRCIFDLDELRNDIRNKKFQIDSMRDKFLVKGCV